MRANDLDAGRLRRLAGLRAPGGAVLSLYLDLDPTEGFATAPARETQTTSLLDEADRRIREADLDHGARKAARADLERLRDALTGNGLASDGAQGVALFAYEPAELFEVVRLPRPVASRAVVDDAPWLEPLVSFGQGERVCVALVDRRHVRLMLGDRDGLEELSELPLPQGEPTEAHRRATDQEVREHVKRVARQLLALQKKRRFDRLLLASPAELRRELEEALHPYVRSRLAGCVDVPVEHASAEDVRRAAADVLAEHDRARVDEALDRLREGLGRGGRAAAGLADVLAALNERRVETLLFDEGLRAEGVVCPACGWLGAGEDRCPVDGTATERRGDVAQRAAEAAMLQSAEVLVLRDRPELGPHGGIAATLRF